MAFAISAVIITRNEARNIERCLISLQGGVADEIVVMDSFSDDETEVICRKYGNVHFFQEEWMGYARQKNAANQLATNDIILSIDADEALSDELRESILTLKQLPALHCVGEMNRLTNYCGKWVRHSGWYPDKKIRIFHRKEAWWEGEVHETVVYPQTCKILFLKGNLLHYSYHSMEEHIQKADKYAMLAALSAFHLGQKASFIAIFLKPQWRFWRNYLFKGGFRDGYYGYVICKISAFTTFLKYSKLRELHKQDKK
jgi:glycosyltransferase involved in cell wall biosynthesis